MVKIHGGKLCPIAYSGTIAVYATPDKCRKTKIVRRYRTWTEGIATIFSRF